MKNIAPLTSNSNKIRFLFLCILGTTLAWSNQFFLIDDMVFFNAFADQFSYERINTIIEQNKRWEWLIYVATPTIYLIKLSLITTCLGLGFFFSTNRFNFKAFFNVAVFAELIFLFPIIIKLLWFLFVQTDYDLNDLTLFYPLSALNLFDAETLPRYWMAPLQTLNLFEVAYWFLLAYGVADATDFSFKRSFGLVMSSYGVGLVLWVVLVMFLTVTYS